MEVATKRSFSSVNKISLFLIMLASAFLVLKDLPRYPLLDYDEATYASVVRSTVNTKNQWGLTLNGSPWFEKPPLYFWSAIATTKVFGFNEFALRLPSALFGIITILLCWLIVMRLTSDSQIANVASLVLLTSPPFFYFIKEVRLDSGVVLAITLSVWSVVEASRNKRFLLLLFPAIAVGFLFKSFVAVLSLPIVVIYGLVYKDWIWLKSKYTWLGSLLAIVLVAPWHIAQTIKYGSTFWKEYLFKHVFERSLQGISDTAHFDFFYYFARLWLHYQPWATVALILIIYLVIARPHWLKIGWQMPAFSFLSSAFILVFFSLISTKIFTYVLPLYPFAAVFIAVILVKMLDSFKKLNVVKIPVVTILIIVGYLWGVGNVGSLISEVVKPFHFEQRDLANTLAVKNSNQHPVYSIDWPYNEAIAYYSNEPIQGISLTPEGGELVKAPFFGIVSIFSFDRFLDDQGSVLPEYAHMKLVYHGNFLFLLYSEKDISLPSSPEKIKLYE